MDQRALCKSINERAWQAAQPRANPADARLENALPSSARPWLTATAAQFAIPEDACRRFSENGLIKLDALHAVMVCQQATPVPLWLATGYLRKPSALHADFWYESLLRINDVAMTMNGIGLAVDEEGNALLTRRLAVDEVDDADALADILNDFNSLASCLIDLTFSAAQAGATQPPEEPAAAPLAPWIADWQQQHAARIDALAKRAVSSQWHYSLLQQAVTQLRLSPSQYVQDGCSCQLRLSEKTISVLADGDGRHLHLLAPLALQLSQDVEAKPLLLANSELQVLTHCSLALSGDTLCLVCRWDSSGLDGDALAAWLADFMTLSIALDRRKQIANSAGR